MKSDTSHPSTIAVCTTENAKSAALMFDRIYVVGDASSNPLSKDISLALGLQTGRISLPKFPNDSPIYALPPSLQGAIMKEVVSTSVSDTDKLPDSVCFFDLEVDKQAASELADIVRSFSLAAQYQKDSFDPTFLYNLIIRSISRVYRTNGYHSIPLYSKYTSFETEFPSEGNDFVYEAALDQIKTLDESKTSWEQILEIRSDQAATTKLHALRGWLEHGIQASCKQEAEKIIAETVSGYQWALDKHGCETKWAGFTYLLKTGLVGVADYLDAPDLAVTIAAAGLAVDVVAWVGKRHITYIDNVERSDGSTVAFIQDVNRRLRQGMPDASDSRSS